MTVHPHELTAEEIRQACERIQATWTDAEREKRRRHFATDTMKATRDDLDANALTIPVVSVDRRLLDECDRS